jgi:hypothetical protein
LYQGAYNTAEIRKYNRRRGIKSNIPVNKRNRKKKETLYGSCNISNGNKVARGFGIGSIRFLDYILHNRVYSTICDFCYIKKLFKH